MYRFCGCRDCKKARRKGLVLGSRRMGFWVKSFNGDHYEHYLGNVSAYVRHPKFAKGKRVRRPNNPGHPIPDLDTWVDCLVTTGPTLSTEGVGLA